MTYEIKFSNAKPHLTIDNTHSANGVKIYSLYYGYSSESYLEIAKRNASILQTNRKGKVVSIAIDETKLNLELYYHRILIPEKIVTDKELFNWINENYKYLIEKWKLKISNVDVWYNDNYIILEKYGNQRFIHIYDQYKSCYIDENNEVVWKRANTDFPNLWIKKSFINRWGKKKEVLIPTVYIEEIRKNNKTISQFYVPYDFYRPVKAFNNHIGKLINEKDLQEDERKINSIILKSAMDFVRLETIKTVYATLEKVKGKANFGGYNSYNNQQQFNGQKSIGIKKK